MKSIFHGPKLKDQKGWPLLTIGSSVLANSSKSEFTVPKQLALCFALKLRKGRASLSFIAAQSLLEERIGYTYIKVYTYVYIDSTELIRY